MNDLSPPTADLRHMRRALTLAQQAAGRVSPNPEVGAVLVRAGEVVGEGHHQQLGGPHAEVLALEAAGERARGATCYVTLEPCNHHGRTPPCSEALLAAGVRRVVIGLPDPNPIAAGGAARLREAGIEVCAGLLDDELRWALQRYLKWAGGHRSPYVRCKWAMTLDGRIATASGHSRWITGPEARAHAHGLRDLVGAVLIGIGTALADDPLLTCRREGGRTPLRVVLDSRARLPLSGRLVASLEHGPIWVMTGAQAPQTACQHLEDRGLTVLRAPDPHPSPDWILEQLGGAGVHDVLIEGGSAVHGSFLSAGLVDAVYCYLAPKLIHDGRAPGPVAARGAEQMTDALTLAASQPAVQLGADWLVHGVLRLYPAHTR